MSIVSDFNTGLIQKEITMREWLVDQVTGRSYPNPTPPPPPAAPQTAEDAVLWTPEKAAVAYNVTYEQWKKNAIPDPIGPNPTGKDYSLYWEIGLVAAGLILIRNLTR